MRGLLFVALLAGCGSGSSEDAGRLDGGRDAQLMDASFSDVFEVVDAAPLTPDARDADAHALLDAAFDAGSDAGPDRAFDLDRDGVRETDMVLEPCGAVECLVLQGPFARSITLPLGIRSRVRDTPIVRSGVPDTAYPAIYSANEIEALSDLVGDSLSEVAIFAAQVRSDHRAGALLVVDVSASSVVRHVQPPASLTWLYVHFPVAAWGGVLNAPGGRRLPVLMPGFGDSSAAQFQEWGFGCIYDGVSSAPECAQGFRRVSTVPTRRGLASDWFRESGAILFDADGDGTDDIHLILHEQLATISGAAGTAVVGDRPHDVAPFPALPLFHGGRHYGPLSMEREGSVIRTSIISGMPNGAFTDSFCSVSRYVAVLEQPSTDSIGLDARGLLFSDYYGFSTNMYSASGNWLRASDAMNGCVHVYDDGRSNWNGQPILVYNLFNGSTPTTVCDAEQRAGQDLRTCLDRNLNDQGRWTPIGRRTTGAQVFGGNAYVWAWSDRVVPGQRVYLFQTFATPTQAYAFVPTIPIIVQSLGVGASGGVEVRSPRADGAAVTLPMVGRPVMQNVLVDRGVGLGNQGGVSRLVTRDLDRDGIDEFQFAPLSGSPVWLEWSVDAQAFEVR